MCCLCAGWVLSHNLCALLTCACAWCVLVLLVLVNVNVLVNVPCYQHITCVPCSPASRCRGTCPQHKGGGEGDGGEKYLEIEKNMKRKTTASLKKEKKENGKKIM